MIRRLLVVALLGTSAGLALHTAFRISVTADEPKHIGTAVHALSTGRCCLGRDNGPTLALNGIPLVVSGERAARHLVAGRNPWETGSRFLLERPDFLQTVRRSRVVSVLLLLGLGLIVFGWSRSLYGTTGGVLSLVLFAFSPLLLAHGSMVSTDLHAAFFGSLACFAWSRTYEGDAVWKRRQLAGVCLGLALAAKHSLLALLPAFFLLEALEARRRGADTGRSFLASGVRLGAALLPAALVLWLVYGARATAIPLSGGPPAVPFLADWIDGFRAVLELKEEGWPTYLLGETRTGGWWYYFPLAVALKTPLPALLALAVAAIASPWIDRVDRRREAAVWIPALAVLAAAMASSLNLGVRHVLPIYPLAHVFVGRLARARFASSRAWRGALVLLGLWYAGGTLVQHPRHLAFFNELAGGESRGWRFLAGSNLDMGQGLLGLGRYMEERDVPVVRLAYFGPIPPAAYGIRHQSLPAPLEPLDGEPYRGSYGERELLAVRASILAGAYPQVRETYAWLRPREPVARLEGALFVFDIGGEPEAKRALVEIYRRAGAEEYAEVERRRLAGESRSDPPTR